ncbi:MAG: nucleotide exchange factor GrpE [Alphaproteobacteria bacterium]
MTADKKDDVFIDPMLQAQEVDSETDGADTIAANVQQEAGEAYAANANDTVVAEDAAEGDAATEGEAVEEDWKVEFEKMKDKALRAMAEMENVRRRTDREKVDASKYAVTSFARDILAIADNIERSLAHLPEDLDEAIKPFIEGIQMTEQELLRLFGKHGIKKIEPKIGEDKYDHNQHEAMFEMPTDEFPAGTVAQLVQTGYILHDRLLRPARVGVAKALPAAE